MLFFGCHALHKPSPNGLGCSCALACVSSVFRILTSIDWSLKVYTQLAREGVVLTQDGGTELSLVLSSRRVAARGDSCKEAIGEINLPFLPLSVPLYLIHKSLIDTWNSLI